LVSGCPRIPPHETDVCLDETDFNLDFYTEVQDLSHLENALSTKTPRFAALNMAICSLIEDYGLVGFETLAVEVLSFSFVSTIPDSSPRTKSRCLTSPA
jgi:hypothetical protein